MHWRSKKPYLAPLFSLIFAISVLWILALQVTDSYNAEIKRASLETETLGFAIEQKLLATFREIELTQDFTIEHIEQSIFSENNNTASINKTFELLQRHLKYVPVIDAVGIIDAAGRLITSASDNTSANKNNYNQLINFVLNNEITSRTIIHTNQPKNTLIITHQIKYNKLNSATIFSSISQATIEKTLSQFNTDRNTSIAIVDLNSNTISQTPANTLNQFDKNELKALAQSNQAFRTLISHKNTTAVITNIRRIGTTSLFIIVSNHDSKYLSTWKRTTLIYILGSFLMLGLSLLMIYYFWRSQRLNQTLIQKENKLIASETRFRQMIEAMPIGLILARMPDFLIMYINQPAAQTLNMPQATALSKRAFDIYNEKIEFTEQINRVIDLKTPQNIECILQKNTHELFWGRISISMVQVAEMQTLLIGMIDISEQKKLEAELKHQATIDVLSGLFNRAHFIHSASNEIQRIQRYQRNSSLLMLDIDHFKRVNDNYGHDAGDLVIRAIALTCKKVLRDIDILGRLGGEEFAALLPETTLEVALQVAERLRSAIEKSKIQLNDGQIIKITSSIGVTEVTIHDELIDIPLKRADLAMYASKNNGRNQVQFAQKE